MTATSTSEPATKTELAVTGMTCGNCARHVTEAIQTVPGVRNAIVSLDARQASVRWTDGAPQNIPAVVKAVEAAGYGAKVLEAGEPAEDDPKLPTWEVTLWLGIFGTLPLMAGEWVFGVGMMRWFQWFAFALAAVVQVFAGAQFYRGAWNQLKVRSANMDTLVALGSTTAFVYSAWALLSGYGGHLYFMEAAAIITLISAGHWVESRVTARASGALRQLLDLAPPTARRILTRSSRRQETRNKNFELLPSIASKPSGVFNPKAEIQNLLTLTATDEEEEEEVPVGELNVGDIVALRPGDRVPTDGTVVEGNSAVDESMLTGESMPLDKTAGSELFAGTSNLNGRLRMRVSATGEATALAHIIAAVQRAQTSRANIQRLGDRVSNVFVPIVVSVAVLAALWWGLMPESALRIHHWLAPFLWPAQPPATAITAAFIIAAAVLIVACPCAMGLATPAAIMAGSNAAAQRGILIRDGVALEKAGEVTAVLFDKTGTLTSGKPTVAETWVPDGTDLTRTGIAAASLARHSTHPISRAIARISSDPFEIVDWKEVRGSGVQGGRVAGDVRLLRLGSLRWLQENGVDLSGGNPFIDRHSATGATVIGLAEGNTLNGLWAIQDTLKPGAAQTVKQLREQSLKLYLVTGDNAKTAAAIAKQAGIAAENVFAEVRPERKAELVRQLQQRGERVAFVGDGINDAPALEQADLGIAVSRASDIAREAADIVLLKSEIEAVPEALGLARATLRTIKQNLFWAFFYNAVGIPLAALGFMSPVLCAAAMGFSDLIVIGNALRLRRWKLR